MSSNAVAYSNAALTQSFQQFTAMPDFELLELCDSTNSELTRRINSGLQYSLVLVAGEQSAGRGRRNRAWQAKGEQSICFSLAVEQRNLASSGLSLVVGLALAEQLNHLFQCNNFRLKWPNDLLIVKEQQIVGKVAGILIERQKQKLVAFSHSPVASKDKTWDIIGIGINYLEPDCLPLSNSKFPPFAAIGCASLGGILPRREDIIANVVKHLIDYLEIFAAHGFLPFCQRWEQLHHFTNQQVQISDEQQLLHTGICLGVDDAGNLILENQYGKHIINVGDLSLRAESRVDG